MSIKAFMSRKTGTVCKEYQIPLSQEFVDEDGVVVPATISLPTTLENDAIKQAHSTLNEQTGKMELNNEKYLEALTVASIKVPNLNDVELQNAYGCKDATTLLKTMLSFAEYAQLQSTIVNLISKEKKSVFDLKK